MNKTELNSMYGRYADTDSVKDKNNMFKLRVTIEVGYKELYFDFEDPEEAFNYAMTSMMHLSSDSDIEPFDKITVEVIRDPIVQDVLDAEANEVIEND